MRFAVGYVKANTFTISPSHFFTVSSVILISLKVYVTAFNVHEKNFEIFTILKSCRISKALKPGCKDGELILRES